MTPTSTASMLSIPMPGAEGWWAVEFDHTGERVGVRTGDEV